MPPDPIADLPASYNTWLVTLSIVVAFTVSYTALTLTARVAEAPLRTGRYWLLGGACAMGIGIWSMHFIGMLAYSVGIPLRYGMATTGFSLLIAIVTSGFALGIASRTYLSHRRLAAGAVIMGSGIASMHYTGMAALTIVPGIRYDVSLVVASLAIAVGASAAALWLAFRLRDTRSRHAGWARIGAALAMGFAISGMHYTGMAACHVAPGSVCYGGSTFDNDLLAMAIGVIALGVLALTLVTSVYDSQMVARIRGDAAKLEKANRELQEGRNLLALATQSAGISIWEMEISPRALLWMESDIPALRAEGRTPTQHAAHLLDMVDPEDRSALDQSVSAAVAEQRDVCTFRHRFRIAPEKSVHMESHARIMRDAAGRPHRLLGVSRDITQQLQHEQRERDLQNRLRHASREAGRAEVAAGVLHNVGNVLNSLGVSTSMILTRLQESRVEKLQDLATLLTEQREGLGQFLQEDPRGKHVVPYLEKLSRLLTEDNRSLLHEARAIESHVGHIRNIVAAQQALAGRGGVTEQVNLAELLEHCLSIHLTPGRHASVHRDYAAVPTFIGDRHKVLQIVGNLLTNAKQAMAQGPRAGADNELSLALTHQAEDDTIRIQVRDTGAGIKSADFKRLFEFGFTTKAEGHGYGLHNSALLAREMGGSLTAHSDGEGHGAEFILTLPVQPPRDSARNNV